MEATMEFADPAAPRLSVHARARMQQRGIGADVLERLFAHGRTAHDHQGATILYFNGAARQKIVREEGARAIRRLDKWRDAYAVLGRDGEVLTVGHRTRRICRH
jgi:hypothetical protein